MDVRIDYMLELHRQSHHHHHGHDLFSCSAFGLGGIDHPPTFLKWCYYIYLLLGSVICIDCTYMIVTKKCRLCMYYCYAYI